MKRLASNLAILLILATAITAVLAMLADSPQQAADDGSDSAAASEGTGVLAQPEVEETGGDADSAAPATSDATDGEAGAEAAKPDHLETNEDDATAAADAPETAVAGAVAQASDGLANTGPIELLQWLVIGSGIVATGGMVRGAARDWANGDLTVL